MTDLDSMNRVTVNGSVLQQNYRIIADSVPAGVDVLAVVKSDGYGHDMVFAARMFAEAGCRSFGVAEIAEGVRLRQAGIGGAIYTMVGFPAEQAEQLFTCNLTPIVFSLEDIDLLARTAERLERTLDVHLKVDCGMSRLGVMPHEVERCAGTIAQAKGLRFGGVLSHFAASDDAGSPTTAESYALYTKTCRSIENHFSGIRHIANSGAVLNFPETHCNMVRAGISLYGYAPDGRKDSGQINGRMLQPAMSYTTRVVQVKDVPAGAGVSYGHTYTTRRPTRLAVLPVGYGVGYPRSLSNCGEVLVRGRKAPLLGRVCMNLCMADITDIGGVAVGDEAVLLGAQGDESITADDIAAWADTISYEVLCMLGKNNQRVLIE